jgi:hypothetical protein
VEGGWTAVEFWNATAEQSARLFRKLEYLWYSPTSPMVGLLGTVVGMIMAFKQVAETQGSAAGPATGEGIIPGDHPPAAGRHSVAGGFRHLPRSITRSEAAYLALHAAPLKRRRVRQDTMHRPRRHGRPLICAELSGFRTVGINMTPMIDVVFQLIIFFLVTNHLVSRRHRCSCLAHRGKWQRRRGEYSG